MICVMCCDTARILNHTNHTFKQHLPDKLVFMKAELIVVKTVDKISNHFKYPKLFISLRTNFKNRGALILRAEIKPIEPDPGRAGEGKTRFS